MALKHLDLEEQEQLDSLKAFWKQYGNLISAVLIVVFGAIAAHNIYQWWQRDKAMQAAQMYDEVERMAKAGDSEKLSRALSDMKDQFSGTTYAAQASLLAAKSFYEKGKSEQAKAALEWVANQAGDESYRAVAKLRLASLLFEAKNYDGALKLTEGLPKEFQALAADRRGDILLAQGKRDEARKAFEAAYQSMDERSEYRRLVEVKLNALGVEVAKKEPAVDAAAPAAASAVPAAAPAAPAASAEKK